MQVYFVIRWIEWNKRALCYTHLLYVFCCSTSIIYIQKEEILLIGSVSLKERWTRTSTLFKHSKLLIQAPDTHFFLCLSSFNLTFIYSHSHGCIRGNLGFSVLPRDILTCSLKEPGIKLTFRLIEDQLNHLSHSYSCVEDGEGFTRKTMIENRHKYKIGNNLGISSSVTHDIYLKDSENLKKSGHKMILNGHEPGITALKIKINSVVEVSGKMPPPSLCQSFFSADWCKEEDGPEFPC